MPSAFPSIAPRGHRPRLGSATRVMLSGARVNPDTAAQIIAWMAIHGISQGLVIDTLVSHAIASRFTTFNKRAVPASTPKTARTNIGKPHTVRHSTTVNRKAHPHASR